MAKIKSILKNNENTKIPRFSFTPKTGNSPLKQMFSFFCVVEGNKHDSRVVRVA